jgi:hypothetical protein
VVADVFLQVGRLEDGWREEVHTALSEHPFIARPPERTPEANTVLDWGWRARGVCWVGSRCAAWAKRSTTVESSPAGSMPRSSPNLAAAGAVEGRPMQYQQANEPPGRYPHPQPMTPILVWTVGNASTSAAARSAIARRSLENTTIDHYGASATISAQYPDAERSDPRTSWLLRLIRVSPADRPRPRWHGVDLCHLRQQPTVDRRRMRWMGEGDTDGETGGTAARQDWRLITDARPLTAQTHSLLSPRGRACVTQLVSACI